jgi:hypothetical protein
MNHTGNAPKHLLALIGKRVQLQYTNDPYTGLRQGDKGVVNFVDDVGTLHVNWDSGSSLGLVSEDGDKWIVID